MYGGNKSQDTICAISTPHGFGGISVVRVSGPKALLYTQKNCKFLHSCPVSHTAHFGRFLDSSGAVVDEVLVLFLAQGKSYTGDETLEISCHGNPIVAEKVVRELIKSGCRAADPGEFTFRAFMNNNLDLVQAESVLSLIESQSQLAAKQAVRQLEGELSKKLEVIESDLTWAMANLEVGIDFSAEDIEVIDYNKVLNKLANSKAQLDTLVASYNSGRIVKEGFKIALIGLPNVGKSSLLNLVAGEERAIVTDVPGTTRDLIDLQIMVNGALVKFIDTAGLRESADIVEKIGVEKSKKVITEADLLFFVLDATKEISEEEAQLLSTLDPQKTFILMNKTDLVEKDKISELIDKLKGACKTFTKQLVPTHISDEQVIFVSAKNNEDYKTIIGVVEADLNKRKLQDETLLTSLRQFDNLRIVQDCIERASELLANKSSIEFAAVELKEALLRIHEVLGKRFDDQILDRVFKEFCIGK